jgi:16S rRNA G966 N2-methylase RsmD
VDGALVLDAFAGTGALGLEALRAAPPTPPS